VKGRAPGAKNGAALAGSAGLAGFAGGFAGRCGTAGGSGSQAEALDKLMNGKNNPISCMIALEVNKDELVRRLLNRGKTSGRTDDQDEAKIQNRIAVYENETMPVASYYKKQGKFNAIPGVGTIEEIFANISKVIDARL
jgi:adenylate kinase